MPYSQRVTCVRCAVAAMSKLTYGGFISESRTAIGQQEVATHLCLPTVLSPVTDLIHPPSDSYLS